jgi:hypothetical protein
MNIFLDRIFSLLTEMIHLYVHVSACTLYTYLLIILPFILLLSDATGPHEFRAAKSSSPSAGKSSSKTVFNVALARSME